MPTEPLAALLYICLLLPGIAFIRAYEGHRPVIKRSAFRETATVIIASAGALTVVLFIHYVLGFFFDGAREALKRFFMDPGAQFREDSQFFIGVVLTNLMFATVVAAVFGSAWATRIWRACKAAGFKLRKKEPPFEGGLSSWNVAFDKPEFEVSVGVHLKSGAWVQGILNTYTDSGEERPDRALTLTGEIWYMRPDSENAHRLESHGIVIIQAAEIDYLTVGYKE